MLGPIAAGRPGTPAEQATGWAPDLGSLRLLGGGRTVALLRPDATVLWWCAPEFDDPPLCWQLLDPDGGLAAFSGTELVESDPAPAGSSTRTLLRGEGGVVEVRDALLDTGSGVALVRLVRPRSRAQGQPPGDQVPAYAEHVLRLGGSDRPTVQWTVDGTLARGSCAARGRDRPVLVRADRHELRDGVLHSTVRLSPDGWSALVVAVDGDPGADAASLAEQVERRDSHERDRLARAHLPRPHPDRARDALAVLRACTYRPNGAVVAAPTTSLPEAPGHDRQYDYRYTWLRDASLSTAVAALLGQHDDARRYLQMVNRSWADRDLLDTPVLDVRGEPVPAPHEVPGVRGWAGSVPVRVGNVARDQRQYDAVGLLAEAVSVYVQAGGTLDRATWRLVSGLADQVAAGEPERVQDSNGIWELPGRRQLVDGDIGRWLVLDRALWVARGWRPWTRRRHWRAARDVIGQRLLSLFDERGTLPHSYDGEDGTPDASALMAVASACWAATTPAPAGSSTTCWPGSEPGRSCTASRRRRTARGSRAPSCRCRSWPSPPWPPSAGSTRPRSGWTSCAPPSRACSPRRWTRGPGASSATLRWSGATPSWPAPSTSSTPRCAATAGAPPASGPGGCAAT